MSESERPPRFLSAIKYRVTFFETRVTGPHLRNFMLGRRRLNLLRVEGVLVGGGWRRVSGCCTEKTQELIMFESGEE